jgi:myosin V
MRIGFRPETSSLTACVSYYTADYENPIAPEILRFVASRVVPNDKNDHLLLPPEIESASNYETPLPREVTGIESALLQC